MHEKKAVSQRIALISLMREKGISVHTRISFMIYVALLKNKKQADIVVKESKNIIESGATEQEFLNFLKEKYKVRHVLEMTNQELEEIKKNL